MRKTLRRRGKSTLHAFTLSLSRLVTSAKNRNLFWMVIREKCIVANGIGIPRDPPDSIRLRFLRCHTLDRVLEAGDGLVNLRSDDG